MNITNILLCVTLCVTLVLGGCSKKGDEESEGGSSPEDVKLSEISKDAVEKAKEVGSEIAATAKETASEVKDKAVKKVKTIIEQFEADQNTTIEKMTADAKTMAAERLRKMAELYRDSIAESQQNLRGLTEKFVALEDEAKNGPQGQAFKMIIDDLHKSITGLKGRFQVYFDQLKELSGDTTGLE